MLNPVHRSGGGFGAVRRTVGSYQEKMSSSDNKGDSWLESERSSMCWIPSMSLSQKISFLRCLTKHLTKPQYARALKLI